MARPHELDNRFLDSTIRGDVTAAYGSLHRFAQIADLDYYIVKRVLTNESCRSEEIDIVLDKWNYYNPVNIKKVIDEGRDFDRISNTLLDIMHSLSQ